MMKRKEEEHVGEVDNPMNVKTRGMDGKDKRNPILVLRLGEGQMLEMDWIQSRISAISSNFAIDTLNHINILSDVQHIVSKFTMPFSTTDLCHVYVLQEPLFKYIFLVLFPL